jgi:DNA-binding beta-propeller fold protein YncE
VTVRNDAGEAQSPRPFVIPVAFTVKLAGPGPVDLAAEPRRGEVWVAHGIAGADLGAVSVVGLKTREVLATIPVQRGPREIAVAATADRPAAAVTNGLAATTTLIDVASRQVRGHVPAEPNPNGVAFRPDGRIAYVVCQGDEPAAPGLVLAIDADAARVVARIQVGRGPARVVFAPDGKLAFVNEVADGTVAVIDAAAHRVVDRAKVGGSPASKPSEVAVAPETFPLLVANPGTRNASIVTSDLRARDLDAGFAVSAAAITAPGKQGWLAGPDEKIVLVADLGGGVLSKLRGGGAGNGPKSVVPTPDGRGVFVANPDAGAVTVYDATTQTLQAIVPAPGVATRGVVGAGGALVCFICAKSAELIAIGAASVLP